MVELKSLIAPSFYSVHRDIRAGRHTHYWFKGGRGSTKSYWELCQIKMQML